MALKAGFDVYEEKSTHLNTMRYSVKRKWYNGKSKRLRARSASGLLKNTGKFASKF